MEINSYPSNSAVQAYVVRFHITSTMNSTYMSMDSVATMADVAAKKSTYPVDSTKDPIVDFAFEQISGLVQRFNASIAGLANVLNEYTPS